MRSAIYSNLFRITALLLFQVLILNNIKLHGLVSPYIYPLGILLLPFATPRWATLVIAFAAGLFVDMFNNTPGLHASATLILAFTRQYVITMNRPVGDYEPTHQPTIASLGLYWFFSYAGILVLLHHFFFFIFEAYTLSFFVYTLAKIVASAAASLLLMLLFEYLFYYRNQ
ncbi:rod shape-determining protein MreD [Sphingobacteriales bacterium UPWRP_1]|nr:hypothetical protein BVG80_01185 [Sphingobacteriales bacterium TSM_CSM]PSJ72693.1 rod shape-determining protein MreD [Sphingobacteriales bacterium UPWRP_1]